MRVPGGATIDTCSISAPDIEMFQIVPLPRIEIDVHQDGNGGNAGQRGKRLLPRRHDNHIEAGVLQDELDEIGDRRVVVDQEDRLALPALLVFVRDLHVESGAYYSSTLTGLSALV